MTVHYDGNTTFLECEECPETTDCYEREAGFDEMIREALGAGWTISRAPINEGGGYTHYCPSCKGTDRLARAQKLFGA